MKKNFVIGVDIGGTRVRMGCVDATYRLQNTRMAFCSTLFGTENTVGAVCDVLKNYIRDFKGKSDILGISIGVPSTLSRDRKTIISTPNIPGLDNIRLGEIVEKELGLSTILERDVNFLLYNDIERLKLDTSGTVIGCYVGTGFGNAVMVEGNLLIGKNGTACELGHIPVPGNAERCSCGNFGCVETIASGRKLSELRDAYLPGAEMCEMFLKHYPTCGFLRDFIDYLSIPVATEINIFDPDYVILGGGVLAMPGFPTGDFENSIRRHVRKPAPEKELEIVYASDDIYNGVRGAGIYGFKKLMARTKKEEE
ncbi:allose kinase [Anaerofilum sp. BX8]|uniref:Allose kinase n=1 Tax=Anaerofilum hominis TaxID=2763016 RepID=A0A923I7U8_9FIRM|nr:allose kinase [Anaerofilum hominis]MBC5581898.1 allose kinase [Anaerofilum hominis]